ncbi:MAG: hypothetical protein HUK14_06575 [Muribaculaceae bacterium]|nr:hypothetical protein [Muribaculaceae bacterium]
MSSNRRHLIPRRTSALRLIIKGVAVFILPVLLIGCSYGGHTSDNGDVIAFGDKATAKIETKEPEAEGARITVLDTMPDGGARIYVRHVGNYREVFNDSNYVHWQDAENIGIVPLTDMKSFWRIDKRMVKMHSCADFHIDSLTHSEPYLIAEASELLHEIGHRFNDTLAARGGGAYRIKVTSLLRTPKSVKRLRRVNRNASDSSTHMLATTFDISYAQFAASSDSVVRHSEDLKGILAEVLFDLRKEGRCWVKYERRQPCFHITTRPKP